MCPAAALLAVVFAAALACTADARAAGWRPPVPGEVTRGFEPGPPYEGGHHRGADFAVAPGATVRAACGGRVVVARRVGSAGRVVTVRCGPWRVSHLPLAALAVREGAVVPAGAAIGTAAAGSRHAGLHLGVRRAGRRFGYTDPLRFLRAEPPLGAAPGPRRGPRPADPVRPAYPLRRTHPLRAADQVRPADPLRPADQLADARAPAAPARAGSSPLAPWPAWLGLALLLAGIAGTGARTAGRRRARTVPAALSRPVAERVP